MRMQDLISNRLGNSLLNCLSMKFVKWIISRILIFSVDLLLSRDRDLLLVPSSSSDVSVVQWPPFLLASKVDKCSSFYINFELNARSCVSHSVVFITCDRFLLHWTWQKILKKKIIKSYLRR